MLRRSQLFLGRAGTTATATAAASSSGSSQQSSSTAGTNNNINKGPAPKREKRKITSEEAHRKLWSPLGAKASSIPRQVISGSEMSTIFFRKLPPERTVESEEDFASTLMLHREFVSKKAATEGLPWDMNPEARSGIEQRRAKASIARGVNEARKSVARSQNEDYVPQMQVSNNIDGTPGSIESVRFVFDDPRMKYCERFQRHYNSENNVETGVDLSQECKALLEACAVLYGCESEEGRESWFNFFLELDRNSLEALEEKRMNQMELLESLDEEEKENMDDDDDQDETKKLEANSTNAQSEKEEKEFKNLKEVPAQFADIYASYKAYCEGKSPTFGNATLIESNVDITEASILRKFKYRKLLEILIEEKPLAEYPDGGEDNAVEIAIELDNQLQALKLYGLRVGESVKEALMLQETRGPGSPGVSMMSKPVDMSPYNPDRPELGKRDL